MLENFLETKETERIPCVGDLVLFLYAGILRPAQVYAWRPARIVGVCVGGADPHAVKLDVYEQNLLSEGYTPPLALPAEEAWIVPDARPIATVYAPRAGSTSYGHYLRHWAFPSDLGSLQVALAHGPLTDVEF